MFTAPCRASLVSRPRDDLSRRPLARGCARASLRTLRGIVRCVPLQPRRHHKRAQSRRTFAVITSPNFSNAVQRSSSLIDVASDPTNSACCPATVLSICSRSAFVAIVGQLCSVQLQPSQGSRGGTAHTKHARWRARGEGMGTTRDRRAAANGEIPTERTVARARRFGGCGPLYLFRLLLCGSDATR